MLKDGCVKLELSLSTEKLKVLSVKRNNGPKLDYCKKRQINSSKYNELGGKTRKEIVYVSSVLVLC